MDVDKLPTVTSSHQLLAQARSASTSLDTIVVFRKFQDYCSDVRKCSLVDALSLEAICPILAIATTLVRHARILQPHETKPSELPPDAMGALVLHEVSNLFDTYWAANPSKKRQDGLLRLLRMEVSVTNSHHRDSTIANIHNLTSSNAWDLTAIGKAVQDLQPPFDLGNDARYVSYIEEGVATRESDDPNIAVVIDVSPTSIVPATDVYTRSRMVLPCRSTHCRHLQCFELNSILTVLHRSARTIGEAQRSTTAASVPCPYCSTRFTVIDLYVDKRQATALATTRTATSLSINRSTGAITLVGGTDEAGPSSNAQTVEELPVGDSARKRPRDVFTIEGMVVDDFRD